jgi:tRNA threonylcarbamoyladenosine biosynthesis protein TsaE
MPLSFSVDDLAGTSRLGRALADALFPGAVIALIGPLGAGKTHLVKAIAEGLGIANPAVVNSPTFVLIQEYDARLPIYHFDAYRLATANEFADLGPEEYFRSHGVSLIEWADKVPECLPVEHLEVRIVPMGETSRRFDMTARGTRYVELLSNLRAEPARN